MSGPVARSRTNGAYPGVLAALLFVTATALAAGDAVMIFDFQDPKTAEDWTAVNDGVMGGVSDGRLRITEDGKLEFFGSVSLENNGGFASIRSRDRETDLSDYDGVIIRVRGDGKRYAFNIRTDLRIVAGSYRVKFDTKPGEWQEIRLLFSVFEATSFGQVRRDLPVLAPGKIRSFGFLVSDKQEGPFKLEVDWIKAGRFAAESPSPSPRS
jgi:NADH dehydrogenase [ubiquinone] 1 alpha subcomplex assembly factor 1